MDRAVFTAMAGVEDRHWWFQARRRIVADRLKRLALPGDASVLEVGCGSGGNLVMLAQLGRLSAFEMDLDALKAARARGVGRLEQGRVPDQIPFGDEQFDLVVLLDVLEHVADDRAALAAVIPRIKRGGHLFLTVPALEAIWSQHDVLHHHFRRYSKGRLRALLHESGLTVEDSSYFNTLLFPAVVAGRVWGRLRRAERSVGLDVPPAPVNHLLNTVFASERHMLRHMSLPVGASLMAVARVS